ncbi:MAG: YdcH family protein [Alphaproteobacteria bacterium]|nr:YdcH family protein [Alphaproteobacteria bacterium]
MLIANHSLVNEFPEMRERIHQMKTSSNHFARLFDEYDAMEHSVHRIESGAEAATDDRLEELKKQRLSLKDELFELLKKAS